MNAARISSSASWRRSGTASTPVPPTARLSGSRRRRDRNTFDTAFLTVLSQIVVAGVAKFSL
jgi:hypothetical protein